MSTKLAKLKKSVIRADGGKKENGDRVKPVGKDETDDNKVRDDKIKKKDQKTSKKLSKSKKTVGSNFLTLKAKLTFTKLR